MTIKEFMENSCSDLVRVSVYDMKRNRVWIGEYRHLPSKYWEQEILSFDLFVDDDFDDEPVIEFNIEMEEK